MEEKVEVQKKILSSENTESTEEEFYNILRMIAPGTQLRSALDGALKTNRGALIVIANNLIHSLIDGGSK